MQALFQAVDTSLYTFLKQLDLDVAKGGFVKLQQMANSPAVLPRAEKLAFTSNFLIESQIALCTVSDAERQSFYNDLEPPPTCSSTATTKTQRFRQTVSVVSNTGSKFERCQTAIELIGRTQASAKVAGYAQPKLQVCVSVLAKDLAALLQPFQGMHLHSSRFFRSGAWLISRAGKHQYRSQTKLSAWLDEMVELGAMLAAAQQFEADEGGVRDIASVSTSRPGLRCWCHAAAVMWCCAAALLRCWCLWDHKLPCRGVAAGMHLLDGSSCHWLHCACLAASI